MPDTSTQDPAAVLQKLIDLEPVMGFDPRTLPRPVLRAIWAGLDALARESRTLRGLEEKSVLPPLWSPLGARSEGSRCQEA